MMEVPSGLYPLYLLYVLYTTFFVDVRHNSSFVTAQSLSIFLVLVASSSVCMNLFVRFLQIMASNDIIDLGKSFFISTGDMSFTSTPMRRLNARPSALLFQFLGSFDTSLLEVEFLSLYTANQLKYFHLVISLA